MTDQGFHMLANGFGRSARLRGREDLEVAIASIYQLAMGRAGTGPEIAEWVDKILKGQISLEAAIQHIAGSPEAAIVQSEREQARNTQARFAQAPEVAAVVSGLHRSWLEREPTPEEVAGWTRRILDDGLSLSEAVAIVSGSAEAAAVAERRQQARSIEARFAEREELSAMLAGLYRSWLDRDPKSEELAGWVDRIAKESLSLSEIVAIVSGSEEAAAVADRRKEAARVAALNSTPAGNGAEAIEAQLADLYTIILDRPPSATELTRLRARIGGEGTAPLTLVLELARSAEAREVMARRGRLLDEAPTWDSAEHKAFLQSVYDLVLRRSPTEEDLNAWADHVAERRLRPSIVVELFRASEEALLAQSHPSPMTSAERAGGPSMDQARELVDLMYLVALRRRALVTERDPLAARLASGELSPYDVVRGIALSEEAQMGSDVLLGSSDGTFVRLVYDLVIGHGPYAFDLAAHEFALGQNKGARSAMLERFFALRVSYEEKRKTSAEVHDSARAFVLGKREFVEAEDWLDRAERITKIEPVKPVVYPALAIKPGKSILVSAIASLYKGGDYIEQFLDNITSQTIFDRCELIIVDADSPENEGEVISRYAERFPNILYRRESSRVSIYDAWNTGVELSRGKYITNTNLDDLRRKDSFERQAEILNKFPFVDCAYQEFFYSFDGRASFDKTAAVGETSALPVVTPYNMYLWNMPHNAPMWRRSLHDELGLFDASYKSAGDFEFWMRCAVAGKTFYKINDPHVAYFVNPQGLSTNATTRGVDEGQKITRAYSEAVYENALTMDGSEFILELQRLAGPNADLDEIARDTPYWRYAAAQQALRAHSAAARRAALGARS